MESGAVVTLVAQALTGSTFSGWTGTGCTGTTERIQVTMSEARTCTATFTAATGPFTLTVIVNKPADRSAA